jgi:hypothetical protein
VLHTQSVGETLDVKAEESMLGEQGGLDIELGDPFLCVPAPVFVVQFAPVSQRSIRSVSGWRKINNECVGGWKLLPGASQGRCLFLGSAHGRSLE